MSKKESTLAEDVDPALMSAFIFYSSLLVAKLFFGVVIVIKTRMNNQIFPNPEDVRILANEKGSKATVNSSHPVLNRAQRMHANDLENIIPFIIVALLYTMTHYDGYTFAIWHLRVFFCSRVLTSICHYFELQPLRTITFTVGFGATLSLLVSVLMKAGLTSQYL